MGHKSSFSVFFMETLSHHGCENSSSHAKLNYRTTRALPVNISDFKILSL